MFSIFLQAKKMALFDLKRSMNVDIGDIQAARVEIDVESVSRR